MTPEQSQETGDQSENGAGEGQESVEVETIAVPKSEYDKLNQSIGSLKRELKDLKKPKEPEALQQTQKPEENGLLQKSYLRAAGITHSEDVELALTTAKKWGVEVDQLVDDEDFKQKLERQQTKRSNELATSNIRGGAGPSQAKNTPEYWTAKGTPPTAADVPDRKTRAKIVRAMLASAKNEKTFYNE